MSLAAITPVLPRWNAINWRSEQVIRALTLASLGYSIKVIEQRTGLSPGQIRYRLHRNHLRLGDYRNGTSPIACLVLARIGKLVQARVNDLLHKSGVLQIGGGNGPSAMPDIGHNGRVIVNPARLVHVRSHRSHRSR